MNLSINDGMIPGTILKRSDMGNVTGKEFLDKIFFISDGVMIAQIRNICGIDTSTLQNWTKRGWVERSKLKRYNIDQVAHILIINMMRSCLRLDRIAFLIRYINGNVDDRSDDIIRDSRLYDYICRLVDIMNGSATDLHDAIDEVLADYEEKMTGARKRLSNALEIIVIAYCGSLMGRRSDELLAGLM